MIRNGLLTFITFVSVVLFPWPFSVLLVVATSFFEPLVPLAIGIFADTLYYVPHANALPMFTLYGIVLSVISLFVHSRLSTGRMT